jgi:two-component system response regulator NreC
MSSDLKQRVALTRILIADDHRVVRTGLKLLLADEPDFEVVGETGDAVSTLELCEEIQPDILVLDLNMPGRPTLQVLPEFAVRCPDTAIVVLTMQADPAYAQASLQAGAKGFVLKDAADEELKRAIRAAAKGQTFLSPELGARLVLGEKTTRNGGDDLSPRELEVLRLIALGHTNGEIGQLLDISVRTVETHRGHVSQKLGCSTRAELVRHALDRHLLDF